jgi:Ca2+-binding EF-hand superfamily protein
MRHQCERAVGGYGDADAETPRQKMLRERKEKQFQELDLSNKNALARLEASKRAVPCPSPSHTAHATIFGVVPQSMPAASPRKTRGTQQNDGKYSLGPTHLKSPFQCAESKSPRFAPNQAITSIGILGATSLDRPFDIVHARDRPDNLIPKKLDLSSGVSVIDALKAKIVEDGLGVRGFIRILKRMDRDGTASLNHAEMEEGLRLYGVLLDPKDLNEIMMYFDNDGTGAISIYEVKVGLAGKMNERRQALVSKAFALLDKTGDGVCTLEDFQMAYDASQHPLVKEGRMTEDEALLEFMEVFETGDADGIISVDEFDDYYNDLSAAIDNDDYFELMIRNAWHISGGEGWCGNTSCRRVLVVHDDGSQEVLEIEDDLGIKADDIREMTKRLIAQGVKHIKAVSLAD